MASAKSSSKAKAVAVKPTPPRVGVRKTYKLYIGGAFPRSESGRVYPVVGTGGRVLAQAAQASRKDLRDAVVAARKAVGGWSAATAYNRGQVLYRVAEMLEGRAEQFVADLESTDRSWAGGLSAADEVSAAVDRWVWYAGWADKFAQVVGSTNPVAGPYFNFSLPDPTGVVGLFAPERFPLLGLTSVLAPALVTGNTAVLVASESAPLPSVSLSEVLATSDLPGGVVNVLTGVRAELAPWLASHRDVNALDLTGVPLSDRPVLAQAAADSVTRVFAPDEFGAEDEPGLERMAAFVETKTVWHPVGI